MFILVINFNEQIMKLANPSMHEYKITYHSINKSIHTSHEHRNKYIQVKVGVRQKESR